MSRRMWTKSVGRTVGVLAAMAGIVGSLYLTWVAVAPYVSASPSGIEFVAGRGLGAENAPIVLFWSIVIIAASLLAGYGAWAERMTLVWTLAVGFAVFAVLGSFSIGLFVVPTAVLLLCSAVVLTVGQSGGGTETAPTV